MSLALHSSNVVVMMDSGKKKPKKSMQQNQRYQLFYSFFYSTHSPFSQKPTFRRVMLVVPNVASRHQAETSSRL